MACTIPEKPNKIRVVFEAIAKFENKSLNDHLLQGPDLTNSLIGVLTRFREDNIAFMGDIEAMFYQVIVPETQQDLLRFFWCPRNEFNCEPEVFRMRVHLFGAVSSPSVANFVLKHATMNCDRPLAASTILHNLYVDDCLRSVADEETAIMLISLQRCWIPSYKIHLKQQQCTHVSTKRRTFKRNPLL